MCGYAGLEVIELGAGHRGASYLGTVLARDATVHGRRCLGAGAHRPGAIPALQAPVWRILATEIPARWRRPRGCSAERPSREEGIRPSRGITLAQPGARVSAQPGAGVRPSRGGGLAGPAGLQGERRPAAHPGARRPSQEEGIPAQPGYRERTAHRGRRRSAQPRYREASRPDNYCPGPAGGEDDRWWRGVE
jgi:hypothetical protein